MNKTNEIINCSKKSEGECFIELKLFIEESNAQRELLLQTGDYLTVLAKKAWVLSTKYNILKR